MKYFCCTDNRRALVRAHDTLNGLDFVEVVDLQQQPDGTWNAQLELHFLKVLPNPLQPEDILLSIGGGERITYFLFESPVINSADRRIFTVTVVPMGDFSTYTLTVTEAGTVALDPLLRSVEFSFTVDCDTDFDCEDDEFCPPAPAIQPEIDYLAKDYASFRHLMLDRLSLLVPDWQERNAADLNIALVELLAYVGDYLSYQQDAIATEAYLHTARSRISVRRHARLVDYRMHDGSNAQVWVQVAVTADGVEIPIKTQIMTRIADNVTRIAPNTQDYDKAINQNPIVFETVYDALLYTAHNRMRFYTWGEEECCLPAGATTATLLTHLPNLKAGDVLIFEEIRSAQSGDSADANRARRHPVRLSHVARATDPLGDVNITEITWSSHDALPAPFCIKNVPVAADDAELEAVTTIALGNIILADHGITITEEIAKPVPAPHINVPQDSTFCADIKSIQVPQRYQPTLAERSVTQAVPYDKRELLRLPFDEAWQSGLDAHALPATLSSALRARGFAYNDDASVQGSTPLWSISTSKQATLLREVSDELVVLAVADPANVLQNGQPAKTTPAVELHSVSSDGDDPGSWSPQQDLLGSDAQDRDFVVEVENDGRARLRFGNNQFGRRPEPGTRFRASYRVGSGQQGNVGSDSIAHIASTDNAIAGVRNPLAAWGGTEPESITSARQNAPFAYHQQERAVTPKDYATFAARHPDVQRAVATLRWTGSWHTIFLSVDRIDGAAVTDSFEEELRMFLERYRLAGHDLEIDSPRYASLEIHMTICVEPDYFRADVKLALLDLFTSGLKADGSLGIFHPDNFTFGQTVYLSPIYAAAQAIVGVASVEITAFHRQNQPDAQPANDGKLTIGRLEIPRLDNNPNFPERGLLHLTLEGGK